MGWKFTRILAAVVTGGASEAGRDVVNTIEHGKQNGTQGGSTWTKVEANHYAADAPGKVESVRTVCKAIIGTDPANVKQNHKGDWDKLIAEANTNAQNIEGRWSSFNDHARAGFDNADNRKEAKWDYQYIYDMWEWSKKADDKRHIWSTVRTIDKATQLFKTANLAPLRLVGIVSLKVNFMNIASFFYLARLRKLTDYQKNIEYKWHQLGGNRTDFNKAITIGYKKKPILAKKMDVDWNTVKFDNYADGDQKTLKIPASVMGAIPVACTTAGTLLSVPGPTQAATIAGWNLWGGIVNGLFVAINTIKIPLGSKESQPPEADLTPPTQAELDAANADKLAEEKKAKVMAIVKPVAITGITLIVLGIAGRILYKKGVFTKIKS